MAPFFKSLFFQKTHGLYIVTPNTRVPPKTGRNERIETETSQEHMFPSTNRDRRRLIRRAADTNTNINRDIDRLIDKQPGISEMARCDFYQRQHEERLYMANI